MCVVIYQVIWFWGQLMELDVLPLLRPPPQGVSIACSVHMEAIVR